MCSRSAPAEGRRCFFFQAEDGIRDIGVTGVQTCALPILVAEVGEWEDLREAGRRIKERALRHLDVHLERLEAAVTAAGGTVHWARDGDEANAIVARLVREAGSDEAIKVKSLATDEIGLNEALAREGITAHETDLA